MSFQTVVFQLSITFSALFKFIAKPFLCCFLLFLEYSRTCFLDKLKQRILTTFARGRTKVLKKHIPIARPPFTGCTRRYSSGHTRTKQHFSRSTAVWVFTNRFRRTTFVEVGRHDRHHHHRGGKISRVISAQRGTGYFDMARGHSRAPLLVTGVKKLGHGGGRGAVGDLDTVMGRPLHNKRALVLRFYRTCL